MPTAKDYPVRVRGGFLQVGDKLFNPEHVIKVLSEDIYRGGANSSSEYHAGVRIICRGGKYTKDSTWTFGLVRSCPYGKDKWDRDPQTDLHRREASELFESICLALEMMGVGDAGD